MRRIEASYRVASPVHLGGAGLGSGARRLPAFRMPSVRGVVRFWWRAARWNSLRSDCTDDAQALRRLHAEEGRLFGAAATNSGGGQGRCVLRSRGVREGRADERSDGWKYLLGQGLAERSPTKLAEFGLHAMVRPESPKGGTDPAFDALVQALRAWGLLGGLGARSRHAVGSVCLQSLKVDGVALSIPGSLAEYEAACQELRPTTGSMAEPPFTALSPLMVVTVLDGGPRSPSQVLDAFGMTLAGQRKAIKRDGWLAHCVADGSTPTELPRRAAMGLPLSFYLGREKGTVWVRPANHERRASPLLAHLHTFVSARGEPGRSAVSLTLLPAAYLPAEEAVRVTHGSRSADLPIDVDGYSAVTELVRGIVSEWNGAG